MKSNKCSFTFDERRRRRKNFIFFFHTFITIKNKIKTFYKFQTYCYSTWKKKTYWESNGITHLLLIGFALFKSCSKYLFYAIKQRLVSVNGTITFLFLYIFFFFLRKMGWETLLDKCIVVWATCYFALLNYFMVDISRGSIFIYLFCLLVQIHKKKLGQVHKFFYGLWLLQNILFFFYLNTNFTPFMLGWRFHSDFFFIFHKMMWLVLVYLLF